MGLLDIFKGPVILDGIVYRGGQSFSGNDSSSDSDDKITVARIRQVVQSSYKQYAVITVIKSNSVNITLVDGNGNSNNKELTSSKGVDSALYVGQKITA